MIKRPLPIKVPELTKVFRTEPKCNNCETADPPIPGITPYYCALCKPYLSCRKCEELPTPEPPEMIPRVLCEECNLIPRMYYECEKCQYNYKQLYKTDHGYFCFGCNQ